MGIPNVMESGAAGRLIDKLLDALFFRDAVKRKLRADTERTKAETREANARAQRERVKTRREKTLLLLERFVVIDFLVIRLRNAGFDNDEIHRALTGKLQDDINVLALQKRQRLLRSKNSPKGRPPKGHG